MKLIIIIGPQAVGKMTVGQELQKISDLKLFHNHLSLELANIFFDWGTERFKNLDKKIRFSVFEEMAKSSNEGLIFTYVWAFDLETEECYINEIKSIFKAYNSEIFLFELESNIEIRRNRNRTENRLQNKPSKRNIEESEKRFIKIEGQYRTSSTVEEQKKFGIIKINNENLTASETAEIIYNKIYSDKT